MNHTLFFLGQKENMQFTEYQGSYKTSDRWLWRFEGHATFYDDGGYNQRIHLFAYPIIRETAKCFVIDHWDKEKFVLKEANRRFAYPNKQLAWKSFQIRTMRRIQHAQRALDEANAVQEMIDQLGRDKNWEASE